MQNAMHKNRSGRKWLRHEMQCNVKGRFQKTSRIFLESFRETGIDLQGVLESISTFLVDSIKSIENGNFMKSR